MASMAWLSVRLTNSNPGEWCCGAAAFSLFPQPLWLQSPTHRLHIETTVPRLIDPPFLPTSDRDERRILVVVTETAE